jgi:rSAM/selenodomain-associated transferase 1
MAKYPAPGRVKTRLARTLGDECACALYRAFVLDLADRLDALPYLVTWAYAPAEAPFAALLPEGCVRPQRGADLGERMAHAIDAALADGAPCVVVLGADVPHVPAASIMEAVERLLAGTDVVLGPARDGGYYLIGARAAVPGLFTDVAWGTADVLATTMERARRLGLSVHLLPPTFDVDERDDLTALRDLIGRGVVSLPRTAAILGEYSGS